MIRLAVLGNGTEVDECLAIAPRLRGASFAVTADIEELNNDAFDAVVIGDGVSHEDNCRFAAARGKHVLLSIPLGTSAEVSALTQECEAHDVRFMVGFASRFLPSVRTIKQSLDSGQLGAPGLLRIHRWQSAAIRATDASTDIDLAIWIFQTLPTQVYAVARRGTDDAFEYIQIHLGFPDGGMGLIDVSNALPSANDYFSLSLIGSVGAAYADDHHNQQLLFRGESPVALKTSEGHAARLAEVQEFVDAIHEQREPGVTGADARAAMTVCEAARQSSECGLPARLTGDRYEC
ncbi:MAG: hypothetical protein CMJ64_06740 [Planctomycetaceae bacterium]|nr:hypothetical protein [Planctomycetaceae bacterium]